jgi:hypothetical protein
MRPAYVLIMIVSYILLLPACISCRLGVQASDTSEAPRVAASGDGVAGARGEMRREAIRHE